MAEIPSTAYVETADGGRVAYQVSGDGPVDLLVPAGAPVPLDSLWEEPALVRVRDRLSSFSRTVWVDQRGWGSSDRDVDLASMAGNEVADEQLAAVADAVGSERFALVAFYISGPWVIRYAAKHRDQVDALILFGSFATYLQDDDCPWGLPIDALDQVPQLVEATWGTGSALDVIAPSRKSDDRLREWMARGQRLGASASVAGRAFRASFMQDVRDCLSMLRVPTLVMHRRDDPVINVEAGRYLAEHIDGAKYVELPGADSQFWAGDYDAVIDEIEEFLTGARSAPEGDVVTATVFFTDIVASTAQSARLGHRKWTALTDAHDTMVRSTLARYRGREIRTTGDGFLATFDATTRAVRAALEIVTKARHMGLEVRSGVHIGEVEMRADDIAGLAASIAKRVCDLAKPGEVLVSRPATEVAVGSGNHIRRPRPPHLERRPGNLAALRRPHITDSCPSVASPRPYPDRCFSNAHRTRAPNDTSRAHPTRIYRHIGGGSRRSSEDQPVRCCRANAAWSARRE